jgi:hypothetical protein
MPAGDPRSLVLRSYDETGAPVETRARVVTVSDGRLGCLADETLATRVDRDPRVSLVEDDAVSDAVASVVRSGRLYDEVHGRLRRARRWLRRTPGGPVLLVRPK